VRLRRFRRTIVAAVGAVLVGVAPLAAPSGAHAAPAHHTWQPISTSPVDPPIGAGLEGVAARNQDGRLEYFTIKGGELWHNWQQLNGAWWGWANQGGSMTRLAVTNEADGRLRVFAIFTDLTVRTIAQNCPNCAWGSWSGSLASGVSVGSSPLLAGSDAGGRLQVFWVGQDRRSVYQLSQTAPNGDFGAPRQAWALQAEVNSGDLPATFAHNADGRPELFLPLADGYTYHAGQRPDGSWGDWWSLGGVASAPVRVTNEANGTLAAYSVATTPWGDNALHRIAQTCPNCGWGGWTSVGNAVPANRRVTDLTIGRNANGRLEIFAVADAPGSSDISHIRPYTLHHIAQRAPGGAWGKWSDFGPLPTGNDYWPMGLRAGLGANNQLHLLVHATDGADVRVFTTWQTKAGGSWA
jgi:hypothetical protein